MLIHFPLTRVRSALANANTPRVRLALAALVFAFLVVGVGALAQAAPAQPRHAAPLSLNVPTPITTPSSLDALSLTSDLSVGGNATIAGTLNLTGNFTGNVLQYPTPGQRERCGTQSITSTSTLAHGMSTPTYVLLSMGQDVTADGGRVTYTNSAGVVTVKGWSNGAGPTPVTTPISISWCVIGSP